MPARATHDVEGPSSREAGAGFPHSLSRNENMRKRRIFAGALLTIACTFAGGILLFPSPSLGQKDHLSAEARIGLSIAPVSLDLRGKNHELVGLGSYIVNAQGGCNDCH